jgi:hypothetical protein
LISHRAGIYLLVALTIALGIASLLIPRTPQPLSYHQFADQRSWLGVANFGDVLSNILFAVFGLAGLVYLCGESSQTQFVDAREKWFYLLVFMGLLLTALGSSYYHLAPDNDRLVWDRLPMTLVFMSLVAAMIAERISLRAGLLLLPVLVAVGIASVLQWYASELRGHGDLRFYAAVQVYVVLVLLVTTLLPPRYTRNSDMAVVVGLYVVAKICEYSRPTDFLTWTNYQRPHAQTSCCWRSWIMDFVDAKKAPTYLTVLT